MKRKKVWRYYCEHCGKSGCSGGHIAKHERGCTANPERVCGMCRAAELDQQSLATLIGALAAGGLDQLRDFAMSCPACMLAAIRQAPDEAFKTIIPPPAFPEDARLDPRARIGFEFRKECESFWREVNVASLGHSG